MKKKSFVLFAIAIGMGLGLAALNGPGWGQETATAGWPGSGAEKTVARWQWVPPSAAAADAGTNLGAGLTGWKLVLILEKTFVAGRDNTLFEDPLGGLSEGGGPKVFVGRTRQVANFTRRGLIYFDLSNSGIPDDAPITKATLQLRVSDSNTGPQTVNLHRLLNNWGEGISFSNGTGGVATPGDATWIHTFFNTQFWTTPGGDFSPTISAGAVVGDEETVSAWSSRLMILDVTEWLSNPSANFGWLLQGNESVRGTSKGFYSRNNATPEFRPLLTIEYQPVLKNYYFPVIFQ
jgi:hypothetical protein